MPSSYTPDQDDPVAVVGVFEELLSNDEIDPILLEAYAATLLSRMRHFNREASKTCTAERERTAEARNAMDQTHLGLQNLLYERRHLEREIQKCHQFEFIYQDVPLYSLGEFRSLAPEGYDVEDEHQLMKYRLEFELAERTRLEERKKALLVERERLLKDKKDHRARLETESREEAEFAKKAATLDSILSELTLSAAPSPAS